MTVGTAQTVALASVTSSSFLTGTTVMLHSFLSHNAWFDGDIVIIHDDLGEDEKARLQQRFARLRFIRPRSSLRTRIDQLIRAMPSFSSQRSQFLSLEAVGLLDYDRVLFCDSDLLFQASVQPLFAMQQALICCGDGSYFRGNSRDVETFAEMENDPSNLGLRQAFNAGFMLMDKSICTKAHMTALIDMIDPNKWRENPTGHTDQLLFNVLFDGKQHLVSPEYNYVLLHRKLIHERYGLAMSDAKVIHFNGPAKPWNPAVMQRLAQSDAEIQSAANLWHKAYRATLHQD